MLNDDPDLDFSWFKPNDFDQTLLRAGERKVNVEEVENWLEENDSDPVCQVFSTEEIAESVLPGDQPGESSSRDSEDEVVVRLKIDQIRDCIGTLIQYFDATNDHSIQVLCEHLRTLRVLIIRQQYRRSKQASEWKLPLRGRITYRHCRQPRLPNILYSSNRLLLADRPMLLRLSASVCRRYRS